QTIKFNFFARHPQFKPSLATDALPLKNVEYFRRIPLRWTHRDATRAKTQTTAGAHSAHSRNRFPLNKKWTSSYRHLTALPFHLTPNTTSAMHTAMRFAIPLALSDYYVQYAARNSQMTSLLRP